MSKNTIYLIILFTSITYSQKVSFFDRTFHNKIDKESNNKREYILADSVIHVKDFNRYGLYRKGQFYGFKNIDNLDEFIWYNANRQYTKKDNLIVKNRYGFINFYDRKGNLTSERLFVEDNVKYIQVYNNNKPILKNGNGKLEKFYQKNNEKLIRIFKDSIEVETYFYRLKQKDTVYYNTDTNAYPENGLKNFYNKLATTIKYPNRAKAYGVGKKITIQFVVDERGNLADFKALNTKSFNFEKKKIKKLQKTGKWIPAKKNGKNVKTRFTIPITFNLN